jgi:coiled-coil domain-containing protein 130
MQGFNMGRYYPPDASNPPSFNTTSRPTKTVPTVRFELPFAIWCSHCTPSAIIGQGVRFNAEKRKVGNYYSTPIWSFRMKHTACGGWWEIRTDPKNSAYVVTEGATKRDYGQGKGDEEEGELKFLTAEEKEKRREDAFANLEGKMEDKGIEKKNRERVEELYEKSEVWRDPYEVNARLRRDFRVKRKVWQKEERHKEGMQDKFSLGLNIVDETDADRMRAGLVEFGGSGEDKMEGLSWKPLFAESHTNTKAVVPVPKPKKLKVEIVAEKRRKDLQHTLVGNTRAMLDPFVSNNAASTASRVDLGILKRKRDAKKEEAPTEAMTEAKKPALLVDYDSD